jgi:hypothetical protein
MQQTKNATKFETKAQVEKIKREREKKVSFAVFYKAKCYLLCRSVHKFFIYATEEG